MTFFRKKNSVLTAKISDDLFLVIDQVFRIFPFFSQIFRIFTMLNVVYDDPFLTRKTTNSENNSFMTHFFYSVPTFARIRQRYFSKYWGGDRRMARPHLKFGGHPPSPLLGLRPWQQVETLSPIRYESMFACCTTCRSSPLARQWHRYLSTFQLIPNG